MVILITGASHTGKTLLAQRMLERYACPYLSIDHLKMGLIRSGNISLTPLDDDALTDYLWPIVREIMKTAIENRQNLIVEGCYVPFNWRQDLGEPYASEVRFVCLAMTDAFIDAHYGKISAHACDVEARLEEEVPTAEDLKADNTRYIEGFRQAGERVVLIDDDYNRAIEGLLE